MQRCLAMRVHCTLASRRLIMIRVRRCSYYTSANSASSGVGRSLENTSIPARVKTPYASIVQKTTQSS